MTQNETTPTASFESIAIVTTPKATRYAKQLCKHFEHKITVETNDNGGTIFFKVGECAVSGEDDTITMKIKTQEEDKLPVLQEVIEKHLLRFAFREEMTIEWQ